jgi:thiosulfate/3-mercaptopyruvate sulfurtransferase
MTGISPLVTADWLAERLSAPNLLLVDIRSAVDGGGKDAYLNAHVPGAIHTDYAKDGWRVTRGMATGLLPDADALAGLLGSLGLTPDRHAIIISAGSSAGDFSAAARVYWTLKVAGHDGVSILGGGMAAWQGKPVEAGAHPAVTAGKYPVHLRADLRCDVHAAEAAVGRSDLVLLDSRSESYFAGREKSPQAKRAGRIPASRHLDHTQAFDPATKRLKSAAELAALFDGVPPHPVINYCNTGHQAATNWFVLSELLHRPSQLYDGSMSEWTEDDTRPVEVG